MGNKIFITGCAKTGTTLVRRLFNAFDLKVYNKEEIPLDNFIKSDYEVGKRTFNTIFSNILLPEQINHQLDIIKNNNIKIINITRDKKNTLKSTNGYVTENRYNACIQQMTQYSEYITCNIRYKELINNPNAVQNYVAEVLDLKVIHKWSDYPAWFNDSEEPKEGNWGLKEYSLRKIGAPK